MIDSRRMLVLALATALGLPLGACEGQLLGGAAGPGSPSEGTPTRPTLPSDREPGHPDAADGVRRLTNVEHQRAVATLFGPLDYSETLAPDTRPHVFTRVAEGLTVSPAHVEGYAFAARRIALAAIETEGALDRYLECDATLPSRVRPRVSTQRGGDLICSYLANCYYPDEKITFPNYKQSGAAPGVMAYSETVPSPGRYRMTLLAHGGVPAGEEPSVIRVMHGEDGEIGTLSLGSAPAREYSFEWTASHAGTHPMQLVWGSPILEPRRRMSVTSITMEGPLAPEASDDATLRACATDFVERIGERAFRRPLDEAERALFLEVFDRGAESHFWDGIRSVIELALQSPQFLYVIERGSPVAGAAGWYLLDSYELATRLSFLAWQSPPDDELLDAARSGELRDPAVLRAQAERLFEDPRARETVRGFYEQWLALDEVAGITRSAESFPELTPELRSSMMEETVRFLDDAIWDSGLGLDDVLTAEHTFADGDLAALYGIDAPSEEFARVELPPERLGLLTHAGLLAAHSQSNQTSPVLRGTFVIERLLCTTLPPPPDDADVQPPSTETAEGDAPRTTRERWAAHSSDPSCRGCHSLIDPVGFAFERFDPIGRFRVEEHGLPIDASGGVPLIDVDDGSLEGAAELARALAAAPQTNACATRQWLRYGLGRLERDVDASTLQELGDALDERGLRAMLVALVETDAFSHRIVLSEVE